MVKNQPSGDLFKFYYRFAYMYMCVCVCVCARVSDNISENEETEKG